jgi:DNA helicase-2/ATP-dependent DNA helicase PcrA
VIALAAERFTKNLWSQREASARPLLVAVRDEADQARYVVSRVLENREAGLALKMQAVLFRTSHHSDTLEFELTRRNIPFVKFGGLKFLEASHVKDVLAALRFAENPRDRVAGFRVVQIVPGIGPAGAARILDRLAARSGCHVGHLRAAARRSNGKVLRRCSAVVRRHRVAGGVGKYALVRPHLERRMTTRRCALLTCAARTDCRELPHARAF